MPTKSKAKKTASKRCINGHVMAKSYVHCPKCGALEAPKPLTPYQKAQAEINELKAQITAMQTAVTPEPVTIIPPVQPEPITEPTPEVVTEVAGGLEVSESTQEPTKKSRWSLWGTSGKDG
jgi:hypothetical protein